MNAPQRILVPTDFSPYADKALEAGLFFAKQFKAKLHVLHVVPDIQQCTIDYCLSSEFVSQYREKGIGESKLRIRSDLDRYPDMQVEAVIQVRIGIPEEEILREEKEMGIDLIVIASHGKTGLLQYLMGSVAERVSRAAKGNVLLVRAT